MNPFQAPHSPSRLPVSSSLGNSAMLEQTAAMMKAATAALQSLQSPPQLYHSPQRQQPTEPFTSCSPPLAQQACYAPQATATPAMHAMPFQGAPIRNFVPVQTAPSVSSIGMQALEELMMSDSSQDSSPCNASSTLHSVQSAPASFYTQASQPWGSAPLPCPSQAAPAQAQLAPETMTQSVQCDSSTVSPAAAPMRTLRRCVSDIPVFDCKAAAAASLAAKAQLAAAAEATQAAADATQEAELADLDLPLLDDCFLADIGSSDVDSDLASGLCFDGFADFQQACPGMDRSDSSSNLLADQALHLFSEEAPSTAAVTPTIPKRKGKQSKKLKVRGGVSKASAQVLDAICLATSPSPVLPMCALDSIRACMLAVPC